MLAGLVGKVAGLGSAAKIAVATATAALTMTVAGGAAGMLPIGPGHSDPTVTVTTTEPGATVEGTTAPTTSPEPGIQATGASTPSTSGGPTTPAAGSVGAGQAPEVSIPPVSMPPVSVPGGGLPDLSAFAQIPTRVLACLSPVVDLVKGLPAVPTTAQIATMGPSIVSCVSAIVADLPLPFGLSTCLSNISRFVRDLVSQLPTGNPSVGSFDVAACIPTGLPVPTGLPAGLPFMGGGFTFGR